MSRPHSSADGALSPSSGGNVAVVREWLSMLTPLLASLVVLAGMWLLWRVLITPIPLLAPISPMQIAADFSVTPISSTPPATPGPMLVIVVTPPNTPTPRPVLWQTATAEARLTATATFMPQPCPTTREALALLPVGTLCLQPTATPVPAITSTPILGCDSDNWLPGKVCQTGAPFAPTPTVTASTPVAIETSGAAKGI